MNLVFDRIREYVGIDAFSKGLRYNTYYIDYNGYEDEADGHLFYFEVESMSTYNSYKVEIHEKKHNIVASHCTCMQYEKASMCKHIAACLIHYQEDIFVLDPKEKELMVSKQILQEFYKPVEKGQIHLKKQLNLTVELDFEDGSYYSPFVQVKMKIGEDRLYSLNAKLSKFLPVYEEKEGEVVFGKNFVYSPSKYFFSKKDEEILNYLVNLYENNQYYNFQYFRLRNVDLPIFLNVLKNKDFEVAGHGLIKDVLKENPLKITLDKKDDIYNMEIERSVDFISIDGLFAIDKQILYIIPDKIRKMLGLLSQNDIKTLSFQEEDMDLFLNGILPIIKDNVVLDEKLQDKIILGTKPDVKIYLDLKRGLILGNLKLNYKTEEIDYFDNSSNILRDLDSEKEVIEDMLSFGFVVDEDKIYMEDIDSIGEFLENNLTELAKKYEVFTSEKLKDTNIVKDSSVRSTFSIGRDNIMSYDFDLGGIPNNEIVDILETLKSKKKYYRLKNGDILDLNQNKELQELEALVDDMELSKKDIAAGHGIIPKYRAIYLDSLKKEKYNIISTNNLFDELMNNFNSYKDVSVDLSLNDLKILRDYQVEGVKWLYNIYKCGFGGILADEMGLGKSIQFIYLVKQIIKEKEKAKVLVVAPTSLIYNWENEFDKFGSELKYKVIAEGRALRQKELDNLDDINVLITTYGLVRQDKEKYLDMNFEIIALDEAQNIKNVNAQMTKIVKELKANTKLALTGTPLENSVLELWSIFDFIMPGYLASQMAFQKKYNIKDVGENDLSLLDNLNRQIKPFILRRRKKDVIKELPEKIENVIYIDLNEEQKKLYVAQLEKTQRDMEEILAREGFKKGSFKILQLLTKLRQLCIDPKIIYENYTGGSSKIDNLVEFVKGIIANGHKILLFTSFKTALDIVNKEFANNNISTYVIDGSVSSKKRMELVDKFNSDDTNVFLITLKAGGTGLNLTSADVVIHLDLWWNPQAENQATDRAHRIGQKNTVEVVKLICKGTIEERILELQNKKKILTDALIEGEDRNQNLLSKLTEKDIKRLLALDNADEEK